MTIRTRNEEGKFTKKSNESREVRSLRLTDSTWEALGQVAQAKNFTRSDLLESMNWQDSTGPVAQPCSLTLTEEFLTEIAERLLHDSAVTRNGKDRGTVRRALFAFMSEILSSRGSD